MSTEQMKNALLCGCDGIFHLFRCKAFAHLSSKTLHLNMTFFNRHVQWDIY